MYNKELESICLLFYQRSHRTT